MNNKPLFFILILLMAFSSYAQDECRGLNFHSIYSFDTHPSLAEHFSTSDSSSIFLGSINPKSGIITKIKKNGLTSWNKKYDVLNFSLGFMAGKELKDKNYLVAGFVTDPNLIASTKQQIAILKCDTSGQLLWNQTLLVNIPKGNFDELWGLDVQEDSNGRIIIVASASSKAIFTTYYFNLVAVLDNTGGLKWNRLYETPYNILLRIPDQIHNEIEIFGNCSYTNSAGNYVNSLLYLQLDPNSGNVMNTNGCSFLFQQAEGITWSFLNGMRVRKKGNNSFSIFGTVHTNIGGSLQGIVLTYSNNGFNSCYRINSTISNSNLFSKFVYVDTTGNAGFVLVGGKGTARMYYTSIDVTGKLISQKTSTFLTDNWTTNNIEENLLTFKGPSIFSFGVPVTINAKSFIHQFQLDKNHIVSTQPSCMGNDTAGIIYTASINVVSNIISWITAQYPNVILPNQIIITTQETPLYKQEICVSTLPPQHPLTLGEDLLLCPNDSVSLQGSYPYKSYEWQDASTDSILKVYSPGIYSLKAQDECGYFYTDTVVINYSNKKFEIGNELSICKGDIASLNSPSGFKSFAWQPVTGVFEKNSAFEFSPPITTQYKVEAIDEMGCSFTDSLIVEVKDCLNKLFIPTAFTPNSDGKNEVFKPYVEGRIIFYQFSIFDRWGNKVFTTADPTKGWDGKFGGVIQSTSTFVWTCEYQFRGEAKEIKKGSVVLIN
jgi:gliding motility-associated-like protein